MALIAISRRRFKWKSHKTTIHERLTRRTTTDSVRGRCIESIRSVMRWLNMVLVIFKNIVTPNWQQLYDIN